MHRQIILRQWRETGDARYKAYPDPDDAKRYKELASEQYDDTDGGKATAKYIREFQDLVAKHAGVFHNLITLPEFHVEGLGGQKLAGKYFSGQGMEAYVTEVQDPELRGGFSSAAHQKMSGSDLKDRDKKQTGGKEALVAAGKDNTQNAITDLLHETANKDEPSIEEKKVRRGDK